MYKNELFNILDLGYNDYIVVVNDEVADVGVIIKPGDAISIFPIKRRGMVEDNNVNNNNKFNLKEWYSIRRKILLKIDSFFNDFNDIKSGINTQNMKKIVFSYLSSNTKDFNALDPKHYIYFENAIYVIFLLKTGDYSTQSEIVEKSGFSNRWDIDTIRNILNLDLKKSKLFIDEVQKVRECINCHKILPFKKFAYSKSKGHYHLKCNLCRSIDSSINFHQKKVATAIFITLRQRQRISVNEFLKLIKSSQKFDKNLVKCEVCGLGIEFLPCFQFHHSDPDLKQYNWDKLRTHPLKFILETVKSKNIRIVCSNCHSLKHSRIFNKYKKEILSNALEDVIQNQNAESLKYKRIIWDELYEGKCSHCGLTDHNFLPAIHFHHKFGHTMRWRGKLRQHRDIKFIKKKLISEMCVALCANCHRVKESNVFNDYKNEILSKYLYNY